MAVAQESEFLAVNQKIRVRIPAATPIHHARDAEVVEAADCNPALTRCKSGRALHFGAIVQQQDDAMALRRSGCDSPWLHHLEGHNVSGLSRPPTSRPIPFLLLGGIAAGAANTRGSTEVPDHFKFRQSVGSDARRWYRRETGATPVGGSYCPVAQTARAPGSDPGG